MPDVEIASGPTDGIRFIVDVIGHERLSREWS
jgi:hypothetical protein